MLSRVFPRYLHNIYKPNGVRNFNFSHKRLNSNNDQGFILASPEFFEPDPEAPTNYEFEDDRKEFNSMQPEEIMKELGKYIVGQIDAKKAVSVAMRNRWRRNNVTDAELRKEIVPKNILMIGPTGVGKTEVARRMAKLVGAPFIKVEATKFTEVGFRGADVDSIIKDLVDIAIRLIRERETKKLQKKVKERVEENILDLLVGKEAKDKHSEFMRREFRDCLRKGEMEDVEVSYEPRNTSPKNQKMNIKFGGVSVPSKDVKTLRGIFSQLVPSDGSRTKSAQKFSVKDLRPLEEEAEIQKLLPEDLIIKRAIRETEEYGIVFIDELDKITGSSTRFHADASDEGVQRDLLPLIEGTKIQTDYGDVDTSKILFITAGAFHQSKPSDLLAELQGRLPIRVQLHDLTEDDLYRILTEPEAHTLKQQRALLKTEDVDLRFTDEAVREMAKIAHEVNQTVENIGARRLYTITEKVLEDISFNASQYKGQTLVIDKDDVEKYMKEFRKKADLKQYIL